MDNKLQRQVMNTLSLCEAAGLANKTMSIKRLAVLVRSEWKANNINLNQLLSVTDTDGLPYS